MNKICLAEICLDDTVHCDTRSRPMLQYLLSS